MGCQYDRDRTRDSSTSFAWDGWLSELSYMSNDPHPALLIVLCRGSHGSRIAVDLESFLRFNAQQDRDLQHLVDRWSDYTTPRAEQASRRRPDRRL